MKKSVQKKAVRKKAVQKSESPIYFRYEFSDETGRPEGGDIFQFESPAKLKKMMGEVLDVAQGDSVTVSFTIGQGDHFFQFLKNTGISQKEVEKEMVTSCMVPLLVEEKVSKPKKAQKKTRKSSKSI